MNATLVVLALSDSFSELWPRLAQSAGAELRVVRSDAEVDEDRSARVLVAAGGTEAEALPVLRGLAAKGVSNAVVVGADTGGTSRWRPSWLAVDSLASHASITR